MAFRILLPDLESILKDANNLKVLDFGTVPLKLPILNIHGNSKLGIIEINPPLIEIAKEEVNTRSLDLRFKV